jgi:hypothetical protein
MLERREKSFGCGALDGAREGGRRARSLSPATGGAVNAFWRETSVPFIRPAPRVGLVIANERHERVRLRVDASLLRRHRDSLGMLERASRSPKGRTRPDPQTDRWCAAGLFTKKISEM